MQNRLDALKAETPKLIAFYNSLDDKQKAAFEEMRGAMMRGHGGMMGGRGDEGTRTRRPGGPTTGRRTNDHDSLEPLTRRFEARGGVSRHKTAAAPPRCGFFLLLRRAGLQNLKSRTNRHAATESAASPPKSFRPGSRHPHLAVAGRGRNFSPWSSSAARRV